MSEFCENKQVSPDWRKHFTHMGESHFAAVIGYQSFLSGFSYEENCEYILVCIQ